MTGQGHSVRTVAKPYCGIPFRGAERRGSHTVILLAAILGFLWQSILVETHFHPRTATISANTLNHAAFQAGDQKDQPAPERPADCPICRELAHVGAYLVPKLAVLDAATPVQIWVGTMPPLGSVWASRSHAWHSRAPPLSLHA